MIDISNAVSKIREFYIKNRRAPTYREIKDLFEYKSVSGAQRLVDQLIQDGVLDKDDKGHLLPKRLFLPYRLYGSIRAGLPDIPTDQVVDVIDSFDSYLAPSPDGVFLLKVSGESMKDAGLLDGDIVIINKHKTPKVGDVVIACVDDAWTLKYYFKSEDGIKLVPANEKFQPIIPKQSLYIGGVVVGQADVTINFSPL